MDTLELCGDILQTGGQLETPGLVIRQLFDDPQFENSINVI